MPKTLIICPPEACSSHKWRHYWCVTGSKKPEPFANRTLRHGQNLYRLRSRPSSLPERLQRSLLPASAPDPRIDTGGSYSKLLKAIASLNLLIIDDWGLEALNAATRFDLMEIMDDRYEQSATVIISQLPTEQWYQAIGDNTLTDAILDRLMLNAHRINLKGESMRKKMNSLTQVEHLE